MSTPSMTAAGYPVHVSGHLDQHLSRWLWLVKWLLVIPHLLVLALLWVAFVVLTVVAFFAILFTGRYPRAIFDFNVGVLRWTWRVAYYAYGALGTDQYPPFTLADREDYPARLEVEHPEQLSRGLALVKWWLLAIPHYLVVAIFLGGGAWATQQEDSDWRGGASLVGLLVVIAGVVLLVTGSYPRSIFDFVLGMNRWALRVAAYAGLMTDRYPPFRLDQGEEDRGTMVIDSSAADETPPPPQAAPSPGPPPPGWTGGRVVAVVIGSLACLLGLGLSIGGGTVLVVDQVARDGRGFVTTGSEDFSTSTAALVESDVQLPVDGPFDGPEQLGRVSIDVRPDSSRPVFVGIGPRDEVLAFLAGTSYDEVTEFEPDPEYARVPGVDTAPSPIGRPFWVAQRSGTGDQRLTWEAQEGDWAVVVMNADGSPGVGVEADAGATLPNLDVLGWVLLGSGLAALVVGVLAIVLGVPRSGARV